MPQDEVAKWDFYLTRMADCLAPRPKGYWEKFPEGDDSCFDCAYHSCCNFFSGGREKRKLLEPHDNATEPLEYLLGLDPYLTQQETAGIPWLCSELDYVDQAIIVLTALGVFGKQEHG